VGELLPPGGAVPRHPVEEERGTFPERVDPHPLDPLWREVLEETAVGLDPILVRGRFPY